MLSFPGDTVRAVRHVFCFPLLLLLHASLLAQQNSSASGDRGSELARMYQRGVSEFRSGDYARAAADLEALLAKAEFTPQLEPAFFTLGSAYFNAGDYKKAVAAFKNYQAKFPNGPHAAEAAFAIAQSSLLGKDYPAAATEFAKLEKDPRLRGGALFFGAMASKDAGRTDQAIATLEKLAGGQLETAMSVRGAMSLAQLYSKKGEAGKAIRTIEKIHARIALVDNIVDLNSMTVELGDQFFRKKLYADALDCYRAAYPREEIVRMQNDRIAAMKKTLQANLAAARRDPSQFGQLAAENNELNNAIAHTQGLLDSFQKLPSITPAIYIRMAQSFYQIDRKWEAVLVYRELLDHFPHSPEAEPALFGLIISLADVNEPQKAEARCEQYLREFKNGPNAETVGYMLGAVALQANDPQAAVKYFTQMLQTQPGSKYRQQMTYLLGNAKFMEGKYDEATAQYNIYLKDFPKGKNVEDVNYRLALDALFAGKYQSAMDQIGSYLKKYPDGAYISDARYRLAVCKYAASLYDEVIADCKAWERDFPKNKQLGEVLALLADSYAASNHEDQAVPVYIRSYKIAATDEVMNYSLFAASKLLQKRGDWDKVADLFDEFIREKPDSPTVISAIYWVGKAKAHEGKLDEAKKISAETIKKYIDDPSREAVELLLTQLAQLCVKKKPATVGAVADRSPSSADPGAELDALLGSTEKDQTATARARILYARAELARLRRQPAEEEKNLAQIASDFKPQDLSPLLLGRVGDYLLGKGKLDDAARFYPQLLEAFPKSDYLDFADNGLGEIAFQKKDFNRALHFFSDGTDRIAASQKLKDLTVGKAKTLLALNRLNEAKKVFQQVASVRDWRGECTAFSVYSLGEIAAKQGHWAEANAYFQRVYVAYQRFLPWVAKAYIASGESFEKLGKRQEAINTYRELLRNQKLQNFAEAQEARKRLEALGQQG
jgi:TolA-binding protein